MRGWKDLGLVETICEEEHEDSPSLSPTISSPPTPLHSKVEAWSLATGQKTNVSVNVQGSCFHLHKERLALRSGYLKRNLIELSEITLSQTLNITAETFTLVAGFCYGTHPMITPFNVAALRTAAELLEMTETNDEDDKNLRQITETFFHHIITVSREHALIVFRSSLSLLPEAETIAFVVSRCIEVLSLTDGGDDGGVSCVDELKTLGVEDFEIIVHSMHRWFTRNHSLIYKIIDVYLKEHNGKMTEEQKTQICNSIDCTKLSPQLLMHAVQNPKMPLRFIVRAMFIEQLNTRRSIVSATDHRHRYHPQPAAADKDGTLTLGAVLQRDATLRQVTQLKAAMDATSSRIQSLEKDLSEMKKILNESEGGGRNNLLEMSGRSESFRFSDSGNKVERGERGSRSLRLFSERREKVEGGSSSSLEGSPNYSSGNRKNIGRRLMNGLKSAFRVSNLASKHGTESKISSKEDENEDGDGHEDVIVIKDDRPSRRWRRSV